MQPGAQRLGAVLAPTLLLLAGLVFYVFRATAGFTAVPGDLGDPRFNSVILEHLFQWVRGDAASLWSPGFFYPATGTFAFSDNHFGSGPIYVLLRFLGLSRELAFDGWYAIGFILNFAAMHLMMRRLSFSALPASVAAFIYAFGLPALAQEAHAQLGYRFAIPMAYLYFLQFMRDRRMGQLARVVIWGSLQFFCSIYLGVFTVYLLTATALALCLPGLRPDRSPSSSGQESDHAIKISMFVALVCAIATVSLLLKYHLISRSYGFRPSSADLITMLPRPQSYFIADAVAAYRWMTSAIGGVPARNEHQLFMGFVPLLLSIWAVLTLRSTATATHRRILAQCLATLTLLVLLTLCIGNLSLYRLAMALPGVSSIRAVTRIVLVMLLPLAVMAAIGVQHLQRLRAIRWALPVLLILALSLETLAFSPTSSPIAQWHERLTLLANAWPTAMQRRDAVLYLTGRADEPFYLTELDAMMFAQDRKVPTLNGYSGNAPPGYVTPVPCNGPAVRISSLTPQVFTRSDVTPESLLARTVWIAPDKCNAPFPASDLARVPPTAEFAKHIRLGAVVIGTDGDKLQVALRVRNDNVAQTLHTLSLMGKPLHFVWRFVPLPAAADPKNPAWTASAHVRLSLPPGAETDIPLLLPLPAQKGDYDLQFSIVAQGGDWFHNLQMPLGHVPVTVGQRP